MLRTYLSSILVLFISSFLTSCGQTPNISEKQFSEIKFDTSQTAILEFHKPISWIFDSTYRPSQLTQNELLIVEKLFFVSVNDFNIWQEKNNSTNAWKIDLKKNSYKKQLIAVTNQKGEKEVWVNCFCQIFPHWKSNLIVVEDGATCFFNFKINFAKNKYFDFRVNSAG